MLHSASEVDGFFRMTHLAQDMGQLQVYVNTVTNQISVFWVMMLCSVVVGDQHFKGPCCLFHPEDGGNMDI